MSAQKISIHTAALQQLVAYDNWSEMASRSGATFDAVKQQLSITYLGHVCQVDKTGKIKVVHDQIKLSRNEETLLRQYLVQSSGVAPKNTWISFIQLPDGPHHHLPFKLEAIEPLAKTLGSAPRKLHSIAQTLGGYPIPMADFGVQLSVFPKLPMALALWEGDDEFPPQANVLFDGNAPLQLSTASLWVLGIEVVQRFTKENNIGHL